MLSLGHRLSRTSRRRFIHCHYASFSISTTNSKSRSKGLFSIPTLQTPADFVKLAQQAMDDCDNLRQQIGSSAVAATTPTPTAATIQNDRERLFVLDAISRTVCNVIDAAELARSVHTSPNWRNAANRAFGILSDYIAQLNSDPALYQALKQVDKSALSEEEARFAVLLQAEFERDGIHLPDAERQNVRELQNRLTDLETTFQRNIVTHQSDFYADADLVEAVIPRHVLQSFGLGEAKDGQGDNDDNTENKKKNTTTTQTKKKNQVRLCQNSTQILQTLLKYSPSPELRRQVYMESHTSVPENLTVLSALIQTRHEMATAMGFSSYADRFLRDKMAGTPANVLAFLNQVQQSVQPTFQKDMELLQRVKQLVEPSTNADSSSSNGNKLEPWDVSFYSNLVQSRDGFDIQAVSQYLSLSNCIIGMQTLVKDLFGIIMQEEEMTDTECWDIDQDETARAHKRSSASEQQSSQVRRFAFHDAEGRPLGILYLDLFPRPGKYNHAAHFTVRCGCRTSLDQHNDAGSDNDDDMNKYQLPIVALVCNLSGRDTLSHAEVETLFHEFGHGLHSLLSRTDFQHMSGTRGAMDFVETPSHLLEHFCWDPIFLPQMAVSNKDHTTPIPDSMVQQLRHSRHQLSSIERQNQILYALLDQTLFGGDPRVMDAVAQDPVHATTRIFAGLHEQLHVPYAPGTHWHSRFGHLITYGAGYYGYLYAQVFANDLWKHLFEGREDRRESGDLLWHGLLQHGGAKDPTAMMKDVLGRPIRSSPSYTSDGIRKGRREN